MLNLRTTRWLTCLLIISFTACENSGTLPTADSGQLTAASFGDGSEPHHELARYLALALNNSGVRDGLQQAMRASSLSEGKVFFDGEFEGPLAGLVAHMAQAGGVSIDRIHELIDQSPDLEMYMPVSEHRTAWNGSSSYLVATVLEEGTRPYGANPEGQAVELSAVSPPSTPTIVLVPAESFTADGDVRPDLMESSGLRIRADLDCGPHAVESCDTGGGSGGGWSPPSGATWQRGIGIRERISHVRFWDDKEGWPNGKPEFIIFLAGTLDQDSFAERTIKIPLVDDIWDGVDKGEWALWDNLILVDWDTDFGTRVRVRCIESDNAPNLNVVLEGTTNIFGVDVNFSGTFPDAMDDGDDECGQAYVTPRLSNGQWTLIPDGTSPEFDGTSILQWYGYGINIAP